MLIVTNGDSTSKRLDEMGLEADVIPWRDVLHDGPVLPADSLAAQSVARAEFLGGPSVELRAQIRKDLAARDARFQAALARETTVILLEHDLYDQLQLAQMLWAASKAPEIADLRLAQSETHLFEMEASRLKAAAMTGAPILAATISAGDAIWEAFMAPDPHDLARLATLEAPGLPCMMPALQRLIAEYPGRAHGLPLSMVYALESLRDGPRTLGDVFQAMQSRESAVFMGDWSFARLADGLAQARRPLVLDADAGAALRPLPDDGFSPRAWFRQTAQLSPFGHEVLAGKADHVATNGIDRWLGGVRLTLENCWRREDLSAL